MEYNTAMILIVFMFFGWIPILAFGKALSWVVVAFKDDYSQNDTDNID